MVFELKKEYRHNAFDESMGIQRRAFCREVLALIAGCGLCVSDVKLLLNEIANALHYAADTLPAKEIAEMLECYKGPCSEEQGRDAP